MDITVTAFGIAKDIIKNKEVIISLPSDRSVGALRSLLSNKYPEFEKLASLKFAVNADYVEDGHELKAGDEVVLIPPVSGG
ncbi:MoaD/ThiS family protein [Roseivirga misakiensis]|uniref:Molybdopterin synthase sulfur carrier subunit n=1 Tax=Roseivirga misakiensis TaxID=1563681 RepID=A0A1E5T014_9BACT|nr:MoaD/ThiS family protein [Roseivirga misakiensis]OEK04699.1 molybdopterin synthase sulfur carrier subunit [Roseivirga misakiensis]